MLLDLVLSGRVHSFAIGQTCSCGRVNSECLLLPVKHVEGWVSLGMSIDGKKHFQGQTCKKTDT